VLAWLGIALGAWPFVAWATEIFLPVLSLARTECNRVSTAFWFLVVGVFLLVSAPPQNGVQPPGTADNFACLTANRGSRTVTTLEWSSRRRRS